MIKFRLRVLLAEREMTQGKLVELTGIRQPTLSAIACNKVKHIPVDVLDRICEVLDCQPGDLIVHIKGNVE